MTYHASLVFGFEMCVAYYLRQVYMFCSVLSLAALTLSLDLFIFAAGIVLVCWHDIVFYSFNSTGVLIFLTTVVFVCHLISFNHMFHTIFALRVDGGKFNHDVNKGLSGRDNEIMHKSLAIDTVGSIRC